LSICSRLNAIICDVRLPMGRIDADADRFGDALDRRPKAMTLPSVRPFATLCSIRDMPYNCHRTASDRSAARFPSNGSA
jgi:hypothetical protein